MHVSSFLDISTLYIVLEVIMKENYIFPQPKNEFEFKPDSSRKVGGPILRWLKDAEFDLLDL
jgi:hypothetical protein